MRSQVCEAQSAPVHWEMEHQALLSLTRNALKQAFGEKVVERPDIPDIDIGSLVEITGDGVLTLRVTLGSGGTYTNRVTFMRIEGDQPVVARFKEKDGKVGPAFFDAGSSVLHTVGVGAIAGVGAIPDKHAIFARKTTLTISDSGNPEKLDSWKRDHCVVAVYQWAAKTHTFDWSKTLSKTMTASCKRSK